MPTVTLTGGDGATVPAHMCWAAYFAALIAGALAMRTVALQPGPVMEGGPVVQGLWVRRRNPQPPSPCPLPPGPWQPPAPCPSQPPAPVRALLHHPSAQRA